MAKILSTTTYLPSVHTDEQSLMKMALTVPDKVGKTITYLYGKDSDKFPLTFMTEGQGEAGMEAINDVQYTYDVQGKMRLHGIVAYYDGTNTKPGLGYNPFYVEFEDNWLIEEHGLIAPDGSTKCRIMAPPTMTSSGTYRYMLQLKTTDPAAYVNITNNLQEGKVWIMTAPTVAESHSRGNRSNVMGAGEMTNQISFSRYTKEIAGNLSNKVVEIEFETEGGKPTNLWINEEMRQFEVYMRQLNEEHLWYSEYNRLTDGTIALKDVNSGKPIPESAGMMEQIKETNYATYGYDLPLSVLRNTVSDVFYGDTDTGIREVVLYGGQGFLEDFDYAIKSDANGALFTDALGNKSIEGTMTNGLTYGAYFRRYQHITGAIVTVKHLAILDYGAMADNDKMNGRLHPRSGKPMSSHIGMFIDQSIYGGENNIRMYYQKNRLEKTGIIKGFADIPPSWGAVPVNSMANDVDASSYEKFFSKGVNIKNTRHCFMLQSILS